MFCYFFVNFQFLNNLYETIEAVNILRLCFKIILLYFNPHINN